MWKNCPHWLHIKTEFWMHNLLFSLSFLPIRLKQPSLHPLQVSYRQYLFQVPIKFVHNLPFPWFFQFHMFIWLHFTAAWFTNIGCSPHYISILHKLISWIFFLLICHAFQKSALTSKHNPPWSSAGSGAGRQKNLPSWLCSVIVMLQQCPKITQIRKLPLELQYYCEIQGHISFL